MSKTQRVEHGPESEPATPCLASRIPYGTRVDPETLRRIDAAERAVRALGFPVLRVRHHGILGRVAGMVVVSGYPCPLYREWYGDWYLVTRRAATHGEKVATEALWLSPRTVERLDHRQLPLRLPLLEDA